MCAGQVEGAFTQGMGLFTMEECVFLQDGKLFTTGPGAYKIPGFSDIPIELNVTLLDRAPNPDAIFSSKVAKGLCVCLLSCSSLSSCLALFSIGCGRTAIVPGSISVLCDKGCCPLCSF